jgi:hypothetical protein
MCRDAAPDKTVDVTSSRTSTRAVRFEIVACSLQALKPDINKLGSMANDSATRKQTWGEVVKDDTGLLSGTLFTQTVPYHICTPRLSIPSNVIRNIKGQDISFTGDPFSRRFFQQF